MSGKVGISSKAGMSNQASKSGVAGKLARCSVGLPRWGLNWKPIAISFSSWYQNNVFFPVELNWFWNNVRWLWHHVPSWPSLCWGLACPFSFLKLGGPQEKMPFFQIASGSILSIPIYLKTCLYGPCKFPLKKMTPSLSRNPPKSAFFSFIPANKFTCF